MCFEHDMADWFASVQDVTEGPGKQATCEECGQTIPEGEWRRHIKMQEHEECRRCEWEELPEDEPPCEQHNYGETFVCDICESCSKILKAIAAAEADAGCPAHARQPFLSELGEAMFYDDGRYRERALSMFPELSGHKFLEDNQ